MIAKIKDTKPAANQTIQFIAAEQKELEPRVNVVTRSGLSTSNASQDVEKRTGMQWVRKAPEKSTPLDLQKNKEVFQQARTFFAEETHPRSPVIPSQGIPQ